MQPVNLILKFDGGMDGKNPGGTPRYGWVLEADGIEVMHGKGRGENLPASDRTNNVAEWLGLIAGLEALSVMDRGDCVIENLKICGDSQLVLNQFAGRWKVKSPHLAKYRDMAQAAFLLIPTRFKPKVKWIPRAENTRADKLANSAKSTPSKFLELVDVE